jgi:hypothetical protein
VITKLADSKGRVALGPQFANQTVIIEQVDSTEVRVLIASVIPQREMWLYKNPEALERVLEGLRQAAAGEYATDPPDLDEDKEFVAKLDD